MKPSAILLVSCPDAKGEVATIADFVYRHGGNILHADEHADEESGLFLMRVEFDPKEEEDVQEIYITKLALSKDGKQLVVDNERHKRFVVTLSDRSVVEAPGK